MPDLLERLRKALANRYAIESEIGRGGMATVFLAEDLRHDRQVAIKVLHPELAASVGPDRFLREIKIAAKLDHPHILALHDSGEADGLLYYVMPFVEGESLRNRLERGGNLPADEAIGIAVEVASGLAYAHERGVVHRDIKPGNILLSAGHARIADFGVARALGAAVEGNATATGLAVGTPRYMSPEQAGAGDVDGRSDTYALGCVLYEMLAGDAPFDGPTPQSLLAKHAADEVPSLRTTDPEIPLFVERVVERAMAKDPADRFQTPGELAETLTTGTVVARVRRQRRTRRATLAARAAVVVLALGLAGWWISTLPNGPDFERLAVLPLADLTDDPEQEYLASGVHEALIVELGRLGLSVTARRTMARYRDTDKGIGEIAEELGVDGVIEGSVFRQGDSLEIATRLYDKDEREIWTGSFDGVLPNVVSLYRGFARAIADKIQLSLRPQDEARLGEAAPVNPQVYEAYLRGMHLLNNRRSREDANRAIEYFEQAVEQNPADPLAYAGLALCYATLGHGQDPPLDAWPRARAAAERAIRLDSTSAEAWAALADYRSYSERNWEGAEDAFRRANELNPSLAMNHYHYAWYLVLSGRVDEAITEHRRAQELDPLTGLHAVWIPPLYWFAGDYERALREARPLLEQYPGHPIPLHIVAESAARLGLWEEAIALEEDAVQLDPAFRAYLAHVYARAGRTEDALRIVRELEAEPPTPWYAKGLALSHAALGNRDEALRWLSFEPPHAWLAWVATSQYADQWDAFRDDPGYQAVLRRMNLRYEPGDRWPVPLPVVHPELPGPAGSK
jgi:serine/threonine-protein kinase